jgi:hypothetical protein
VAIEPTELRQLAEVCEQSYLASLPAVYSHYLASGELPGQPGCPYPGPRGYFVMAAKILRRAAELRDVGVPVQTIVGLVQSVDRDRLMSLTAEGRALRLALHAIETGQVTTW